MIRNSFGTLCFELVDLNLQLMLGLHLMLYDLDDVAGVTVPIVVHLSIEPKKHDCQTSDSNKKNSDHQLIELFDEHFISWVGFS